MKRIAFSIPIGFLTLIATSRGATTGDILWEQVHFDRPPPVSGVYGLSAVGYANGIFVAVGDTNFVSTNGLVWSEVTPSITKQTLTSVTYGNGKFVAVGGAGYRHRAGEDYSVIIVSENGLNWTKILEGVIEAPEPDDRGLSHFMLGDVTYGDEKFVAVGGGNRNTVMISSNGTDWTKVSTDVPLVGGAVTYAQGKYVMVGIGFMTSLDGIHWTKHNQDFDAELWTVCYGDGLFVACGNNILVVSPDGVNWTIKWSTSSSLNLGGAAFGAGRFISSGNYATILVGTSNGNWTQYNSILGPTETWSLGGATFANGQFIVVGECNMILRGIITASPSSLAKPSFKAAQGFEFSTSCEPGRNYRAEVSEDLLSWQILTNFMSETSSAQVKDTEAITKPHRFYRVQAQ